MTLLVVSILTEALLDVRLSEQVAEICFDLERFVKEHSL